MIGQDLDYGMQPMYSNNRLQITRPMYALLAVNLILKKSTFVQKVLIGKGEKVRNDQKN